MKRVIEREKHRDACENGERNKRALAAVMIDFRYQIAGGDVEGHAAGERQRVGDGKTDLRADEIKKQNADERCQPDERSGD